IDFPKIEYIAKSSTIDYTAVRKHYYEMIDGSIGKNLFPAYTIEVKNDGGQFAVLSDGFQTARRLV
ncbi:MAG: hypothetical protein H7X80_03495, partial [bacterium]|nr:hypothetical protein [Candidatus Kapabacteria bacterium]